MTDQRTPPNDLEAERSAIHHALNTGRIPQPLQALRPADFYQPAHETIWATITHLVATRRACDANAVLARLRETSNHQLAPQLMELISGPIPGDPANLAAILLDRAGRRHLIRAATRMQQRAYESEDPYQETLRQAEAELRQVPSQETDEIEDVFTIDEFLGETIPEPNWVLPGLLARGDRLILTGLEGFGKSTLIRQIAMCAAAGMQPFTGHTCDPVTVLMVDCENPPWIMQKRLSELRRAINAHGKFTESTRRWITRRPAGINLGDPADRRWLQRRVATINPDLLVIGPAYKLHHGGDDTKDETIARTVTSVLDEIRGNAALVLEHHAGNESAGMARPVRPFGSSLWRRWPEFGYGIRPAKATRDIPEEDVERLRLAELVPWRGARDERDWPRHLQSGGDALPWIESTLHAERNTA